MKNLPDQKNLSVAIIGLGYVGLPLCVHLAESSDYSRTIVGFDLKPERVSELKQCIDTTKEIESKRLQDVSIFFTSDCHDLDETDVFIVAVPTPVDDLNHPVVTYIQSASEMIGESLKRNPDRKSIPVIIFESTVYPGATEEVCLPLIERISNLKCKRDFKIAYSPERVNPGDKLHTLDKVVKVVSGVDLSTLDWMHEFYASFISAGVHKASSIKVAESAKLIENIQRDLNIALINEFAKICYSLDISTNDVLAAASTKWNFQNYSPGLVGGHCIGVDPFYLTYKAQKSGYHPELILAGRRINDNMPEWIADVSIQQFLKKRKKVVTSPVKCLVAGVTYKSNCPDIRNTKVENIVHSLRRYGAAVDLYDPVADKTSFECEYSLPLTDRNDLSNNYSIIIIAVAHDVFKSIEWADYAEDESIIFDVKNIIDSDQDVLKL